MRKSTERAYRVFGFCRITVASPAASWFETREDALLTMRVKHLTRTPDLIQRSIAKRCVSKDEATELELLHAVRPGFRGLYPWARRRRDP
ncbi:MAG: hypothetical protein ACREC2_14210, partial [Bradyrhizobium sp.]